MSRSRAATDAALEGRCKLLAAPAPSDALLEFVADEYAALAAEHGPRNVLVLKRHPAGLDPLADALAAAEVADGTPQSPRVESVPEHASKVIEEYDPTLDRLEYEERIELISLVIDGASREVPPYLERAADHESFTRDVGQLLLEATRQRLRLADLDEQAVHDCLAFLYAMNDRFHEELEARGFVERADVIPRAVELLEANADGLRDRVTASFDAVLAVEFDEYRRLDRRYLAALTGSDVDLVCLGERHASVERTRVEPERIDDAVGDGLEVETVPVAAASPSDSTTAAIGGDGRDRDSPPHAAIARFLATGERPASATDGRTTRDERTRDDETGTGADREPVGRARHIRTRTAREQVGAVATEIQSLADRRNRSYDEFAVAVPSVERVPETRRRLREAGIPTATIGTPSLAEDPAVNELYAFVTVQCERDRERARVDAGPAADGSGDDDRELERLRARVDDFSPALLADCTGPSITDSLRRWILRTDLKGRIAKGEDWVDAREQYESVRRVLEIARFVEETDLVGPDWEGLRRMLRRTIRYDAPYVHAVETRPPTGGVTVCAVDDLKYDSREVVFLLDLIDDTYPGEQFLTQLFPSAWLREMPHYPAVTDPSPADVTATFATADGDTAGDPFETYHAQRARRRLALGARAATERLYCCSYERGSGGLRRTYDRSRYLKLIESTPGLTLEDVDAAGGAAIHGETKALEALLDQPRAELERVLREASTGGEADLSDTEELFEEIAVVLEDGEIDDELAEAVRSQFEFAAGEVVRND
ncbi:PD-(D/E)XK nuclease family protein [Halopiger thermotolerans]